MTNVFALVSAVVIVVVLAVVFSLVPVMIYNGLKQRAVSLTTGGKQVEFSMSAGKFSAIAGATLTAYGLIVSMLVPLFFKAMQ